MKFGMIAALLLAGLLGCDGSQGGDASGCRHIGRTGILECPKERPNGRRGQCRAARETGGFGPAFEGQKSRYPRQAPLARAERPNGRRGQCRAAQETEGFRPAFEGQKSLISAVKSDDR